MTVLLKICSLLFDSDTETNNVVQILYCLYFSDVWNDRIIARIQFPDIQIRSLTYHSAMTVTSFFSNVGKLNEL